MINSGVIRHKRTINPDNAKLKKLYASNPVAKAFLDRIASRTNDARLTKLDSAVKMVAARGIPASTARTELRKVFKELEAAGCGRYVIGRRDHPSRFEWSASLRSVGHVAAGAEFAIPEVEPEADVEDEEPEDDEDEKAADAAVPAIDHVYQLRPDFRASFRLPTDLTNVEASRLADFIRTLPFGS